MPLSQPNVHRSGETKPTKNNNNDYNGNKVIQQKKTNIKKLKTNEEPTHTAPTVCDIQFVMPVGRKDKCFKENWLNEVSVIINLMS